MELKLKKALENERIGFEYQPKMFGNPDFLIKPNIAIFCDSSFWHGRNWNTLKLKLSKEYWYDHIKTNRTRDRKVNAELRKRGFVILRFWDTALQKNLSGCIDRIKCALKGESKCGKAL